jgi:hypothetical protein
LEGDEPVRQPPVIHCPNCSALRVNRRRRRCGVCGVLLLYVGEIMQLDDEGFLWHDGRWESLADWRARKGIG